MCLRSRSRKRQKERRVGYNSVNGIVSRFPIRPRRLRQTPQASADASACTLRRSDIIVPVFVREGTGCPQEVSSMPGVFQMSVDVATGWLARRAEEGFGAYLGLRRVDRDCKDAAGSAALDEGNVVCRLLRSVRSQQIPMIGITDLCFCEYTSHGHCGPMTDDSATVQNDVTVSRLVHQAINHAKAGAEIIAPSGMMDGTVGRPPQGARCAPAFTDVAILAYSVKYASAFYGPFRDAADSVARFWRPPLLSDGPVPRRR